MQGNSMIVPLTDCEIDEVQGGALFVIPLLIAGAKAGMAAGGGAAAFKIGVSIGIAGATAALAAEIME